MPPYDNGVWRPLSADEIEQAAAAIRSVTDRSVEAPEDPARDFQKEVVDLLADPQGYRWHEVRKIADHLLFDYLVNEAPIKYYRVFNYAADVTRQQGLLRVDDSKWDKALPAILRAMNYYISEEQAIEAARLSQAKLAAQADAAKRLATRGFSIVTRGADLSMSDAEYQRLRSLIVTEATARGGSSLFYYLMLVLEPFWWKEFHRYVVSLNVNTVPRKATPSWPLGYIYNMAAKITSAGTDPGPPTMDDADFYQLISDVCAIEGIEPYNWAAVTLQSETRLLDFLGDLGKLQFAFTIPQMDERDVTRTLRAAFKWVDTATEDLLGWSLEQAITFCDAVISRLPARGAICITKAVLKDRLSALPSDSFESLWSTFVSRPGSVNTSFSDPVDATTADAYFKPLIGFGQERAAIGLRSVSATAWYEAVAAALRNANVRDVEKQIGDAFEPFVRDCLAPYGLIYSGAFSSPHGSGDIDAAFATDSTIVLFELKKKVLTRSAQSGDVLSVMIDLVKGVVKAQSQLAKIEYVLRSDGAINLGTSVLELKGRDVKRVTLSWHDYGVFHDHSFLRNVLHQLAGATVSSADSSRAPDVSQINKGLAELLDWENKAASLISVQRIRFGSSFFYAIGQLLSVMRSSETADELVQHLTFNEHVTIVALDFYVEYGNWLRNVLPHLNKGP